MSKVVLFEKFIEERSNAGRAWEGRLDNVDDLMAWLYRKDILSTQDKAEKDKIFTGYYRFYNDGDTPDWLRIDRNETPEEALEDALDNFIKEILAKYAGKYDRKTFRYDTLLSQLNTLKSNLRDTATPHFSQYDVHSFLYFYNKNPKTGNAKFDKSVAQLEKLFKKFEKTADAQIEKYLKDSKKKEEFGGISTNLILGAKVEKMLDAGIWNDKNKKEYKDIVEVGDRLYQMIEEIIEGIKMAQKLEEGNYEALDKSTLIMEKSSGRDFMNYVLAHKKGTSAFKQFKISDEHRKEIIDMCIEVMDEVGDKGSSVLGSGLYINDEKFLRAYSQGNVGPERIYNKVEAFLNKNYPKLDVRVSKGNMD
jgi:hypothetical protein